MSSDGTLVFTKENLDCYLKELAKEFRKLNGKSAHAEIILVGGAAVLANYGFREMTADLDAVIEAASSMKDAINRVRDKFSLPNGWLNADLCIPVHIHRNLRRYPFFIKLFLMYLKSVR